ncbi:hypothetical protein GCM10027605_37930 [Micromonospora zhanjiangensis]
MLSDLPLEQPVATSAAVTPTARHRIAEDLSVLRSFTYLPPDHGRLPCRFWVGTIAGVAMVPGDPEQPLD